MKTLDIVVLVVVVLMAGGCAASRATAEASDEWRLQSLEENFLNFQEQQRASEDKLDSRLSAIEAKLDAIEKRMNGDEPTESMGSTDMRPVMPEEDDMNSPFVGKPDHPQVEVVYPVAPGDVEPVTPVVKAGPESTEKKPWAEVPGATMQQQGTQAKYVSSTGPKQQYDKGLSLVRNGRPVEGREILQSFKAAYPSNSLVPNAMYWIGESYYAQKNYPQAILTFKDVVEKYPKHHKAAASLLKMGMSYRNSGDKDNAVFYLRTLVDDYPSSDPAKLARNILRELPE